MLELLDVGFGELDGDHSFLTCFSPATLCGLGSLAQIGSSAIRCSFNTRFRARFRRVQKVPVETLRLGSGRFWCRALGEGPDCSGAKPR